MSSNHKPICAYHGNGLFLSFVVSHAGRAATGLQEHRYFHTGICVYLNYVNNSIEIQLRKKKSHDLLPKMLHFAPFSDIWWSAPCIFQTFLNALFWDTPLCVVPQCRCVGPVPAGCPVLGCQPLQLAMHRLGASCPQGHGHCTAPCCPGSIPVGEISRCTKACKFKIGFEENWVVFFPETSCFSEHLCQLACLGEYLQKWNAEVLWTQPNWIHLPDVKGLDFFRLVKLFGVRTVTSYRFIVPYIIGP